MPTPDESTVVSENSGGTLQIVEIWFLNGPHLDTLLGLTGRPHDASAWCRGASRIADRAPVEQARGKRPRGSTDPFPLDV